MAKFTVAIVGAGLSGLLFAVTLQKYAPDVEFEIYEGAAELAAIGAGIGMHRRTWALMQAIGLDKTLLNISGNGQRPTLSQVYRKSDQPEGFAFNSIQIHDASYTFHRGELQKAILSHLKRGLQSIHLRKRFVSYAQPEDAGSTGKLQVHFADGTTAECDLLVGADGIRSAVRGAMYTKFAEAALGAGKHEEAERLKSHIRAVYSGSAVCRALIRKDDVPEEARKQRALNEQSMMLYCGKNRHIITYPISQGRVVNMGAILGEWHKQGEIYEGPWVSEVSREEVVAPFAFFEPDVQELLSHVETFSKWAINVVTQLPTYVDGRVAILGDAAHAMTPYLGAGAGQCFEDAYLLAQFLGHPRVSAETLPTALKVYDAVRRPLSQHVAARSLQTGRLFHFASPEFAALTEEQSATGTAVTAEQLRQMGDAVVELNRWEPGTLTEENVASLRALDDALQVQSGMPSAGGARPSEA